MSRIRLTWKDNNLYEDGHRIYRSQSPMDIENLPEPIADLGNGVTTYDDADVIEGETYHYIISAYRGDEEKYSEEHIRFSGQDLGIGSWDLIGGDMETEGFFGEVEAEELFTGDELASLIGLTAGTAENSDDPWLKFIIDGEIIYIAKNTYRRGISWTQINDVNAVYDKEESVAVTKDRYTFRVTLMTGAEADPSVDMNGEGSEWDRLMYKVSVNDPSGTPWETYSDSELGIGNSSSWQGTWVQEAPASDSSRRIFRGSTSLTNFSNNSAGWAEASRRWRPVLRLQK